VSTINLAWSDIITHDGEPEIDRRKSYRCKAVNCGFWFKADAPRDYCGAICQRVERKKTMLRPVKVGPDTRGVHVPITAEAIADMFHRRYRLHENYGAIAGMHGVSKQTVRDICRGKSRREQTAELRRIHGVRDEE
jgi:hypothetical protein